ncbi:MAG TPA: DUF4832 domain-containing protein [Candidatus Sulfopaludibacter sp.]|jgi:hypothetical protein|nr:DUF4832 domain-containing protein [Candidatus Sulfopaludibacter sp.]
MRVLWILALAASAAAADYKTSNDNFPNPERGFYLQTSYDPERGATKPLDEPWLHRARGDGISMLRIYWVLSEFRDRPLTPEMLDRVRADFKAAREAGLKVIGRFAYNFGPIGAPDAPLARVLEHLDQLQPVLRENADVLAFLEAGFVGTWGEWHDSTNDLLDHDKEILDKILDVLPVDRMVALRYPRLKMRLFDGHPLTAAEAFTETAQARIGAHNDCFLASKTDWGTWSKNAALEKDFYHADNLFVPQGGETCNAAEDAQPYIGCDNALKDLAFERFSTLNSLYLTEVLDGWTKGGCMPEIQRRLGYRFRLTGSSVTVEHGTVQVKAEIRNEGFADLYNPRRLILVLRDRSTGKLQRFPAASDPRRWAPGEDISVALTAAPPPGEYDVLLSLPDASAKLSGRPEYAVRFANEGVWEAATGMNRLAEIAKVQ